MLETLKDSGRLVTVESKIRNYRVVLSNCVAQSRQHPKLRPFKLVNEMIKLTINPLLAADLLIDCQLQFAQHFVLEKQVNKNIVVRVLQSIFHLHNFNEITIDLLDLIKQS